MPVRRLRTYLLVTIVLTVASVAGTIASGNEPALGLDLQGGLSVTLEPRGEFRRSSLDVAVDVIRDRVDSTGVLEPEISRQGRNIIVDLPGVKDRARARRLVGQTGELLFRAVLGDVGPRGGTEPAGPAATTTTTVAPGTVPPATGDAEPSTDREAALEAVAACDEQAIAALAQAGALPTTPRRLDRRDACIVAGVRDTPTRLLLGPVDPPEGSTLPAGLPGRLVNSADSRFGQGYEVNLKLSDEGRDRFNALAEIAVNQPAPQNQVAIVLDGEVQSNPAFQEGFFPDEVQITGDFTQEEADNLAKIINYGALPVRLVEVNTQDVSPTLGKDQLRAGVIAGVVGLVLVGLYMLVYYRFLGLVVILGLLVAAGLTYAIVAFLSDAAGLTLTLAGVTGLIVSIGVTVDSYVVYFERLKDEVRMGRTIRSSVDRGFHRAFRTIVAADLVSLIGAGALYVLAIGSVRGFAFFLGLEVALDLLISYFFMYPLVVLLARRPHLVRMRGVGIAAGLDAPGVTT